MSFEFGFRFHRCFAAYQQLGGDWAVEDTNSLENVDRNVKTRKKREECWLIKVEK